ncbi:MAG TPA: hypothetical protein VII73_01245 [Caulobacteraceae bacterium]
MTPMRAAIIVVLAGGAVTACQPPAAKGDSARITIASSEPRLLEQQVAVGRDRRVTRLCVDDSTEALFTDFARNHGATGARAARSIPTQPVNVRSRWLGPCPANLKAGQMIGPDGRRFEVAQLLRGPGR